MEKEEFRKILLSYDTKYIIYRYPSICYHQISIVSSTNITNDIIRSIRSIKGCNISMDDSSSDNTNNTSEIKNVRVIIGNLEGFMDIITYLDRKLYKYSIILIERAGKDEVYSRTCILI